MLIKHRVTGFEPNVGFDNLNSLEVELMKERWFKSAKLSISHGRSSSDGEYLFIRLGEEYPVGHTYFEIYMRGLSIRVEDAPFEFEKLLIKFFRKHGFRLPKRRKIR